MLTNNHIYVNTLQLKSVTLCPNPINLKVGSCEKYQEEFFSVNKLSSLSTPKSLKKI